MIIIGIGSNLPSPNIGPSLEVCNYSLDLLERRGIKVIASSSWYKTEAIPKSTQPHYINGVASVNTNFDSLALLKELMNIEEFMGRTRSVRNEARIIDLDLITYNDEISQSDGLTVPHPRLCERAFVAKPIADIAPEWHHPVSGLSITEILAPLSNQKIICLST